MPGGAFAEAMERRIASREKEMQSGFQNALRQHIYTRPNARSEPKRYKPFETFSYPGRNYRYDPIQDEAVSADSRQFLQRKNQLKQRQQELMTKHSNRQHHHHHRQQQLSRSDKHNAEQTGKGKGMFQSPQSVMSQQIAPRPLIVGRTPDGKIWLRRQVRLSC